MGMPSQPRCDMMKDFLAFSHVFLPPGFPIRQRVDFEGVPLPRISENSVNVNKKKHRNSENQEKNINNSKIR